MRRVGIALLVIPLLSNILLLVLMGLWNFVHSSGSEIPNLQAAPAQLGGILVLAILYSVPGFVVFAAAGIPLLFILYRLNATGFVIFAVLGAACTLVAWLVYTHRAPGAPARFELVEVWEESKAFGVVGAVNGILTRLIVLGPRWSW
jgi:hypothetical protein